MSTIGRIHRRQIDASTPAICALAMVLIAIIAIAPPSRADGRGQQSFEIIDLVIDNSLLEVVKEILGLSEAQRLHADRLHAEYMTRVSEIEERSVDENSDLLDELHALDEQVEDDPESPLYEEIARLANTLFSRRAATRRDADGQLTRFWSELGEVHSDEQLERIEKVKRLVRRRNVLDRDRNRPYFAQFSAPMNIVDLASEATFEGKELAALAPPEGPPPDPDSPRARFASILADHELQIDAYILDRLRRMRNPERQTADDMRPFSDDTPDGARKMKSYGKRWYRTYHVRASTVQAIADLARSEIGEEAAHRWNERFWQVLAPKVIRELWIDRVPEWIASREDFDSAQRESLDRVFDTYVRERHELRRAAINAGVRAVERWISVDGDQREQLDYARAVIRLHDLHERTIEQVRIILNPDQLAAFDQTLAAARPYYYQFHHELRSTALNALRKSEEYKD